MPATNKPPGVPCRWLLRVRLVSLAGNPKHYLSSVQRQCFGQTSELGHSRTRVKLGRSLPTQKEGVSYARRGSHQKHAGHGS